MSDVFILQMGKTPDRANPLYWNGSKKWVSIADMNDCKYISGTKECISSTAVLESGIKEVPCNTSIMSFKLSVGKVAITKSSLYTNEAIMAFIPKDPSMVMSEFVYYYLKGYKWQGSKRAVMGITLNKASISQGIFAYPPMSEQERIVAELDLLNGVLEKQKAQLKELDTLAQSIFYDMFGDPIENPKGWDVKNLGNELNVFGGYAFKSNRFVSAGIPVLRIGNINSGKVKINQVVFYEEDPKLDRYMVYPGDLVISLTGTAGKDDYGNICKLDDSYNRYYLNQRNAKLELGKNLCSCFVQYYLKDGAIKGLLTAVNRGVRQGNISNKDIENLQIPVPPLPLQQAFADKIASIESQKAAINQSIAETQKLLDYTMDKYFG